MPGREDLVGAGRAARAPSREQGAPAGGRAADLFNGGGAGAQQAGQEEGEEGGHVWGCRPFRCRLPRVGHGGHDGRWCRHEVGSGLWSGGWRPAMGTGGPHRQPEFPSRPAAAGEGGEVALLPAGRRRADGDREEERGSG